MPKAESRDRPAVWRGRLHWGAKRTVTYKAGRTEGDAHLYNHARVGVCVTFRCFRRLAGELGVGFGFGVSVSRALLAPRVFPSDALSEGLASSVVFRTGQLGYAQRRR